jgi:hypothetical protein
MSTVLRLYLLLALLAVPALTRANPPDDGTGLPWTQVYGDDFTGTGVAPSSQRWANCPFHNNNSCAPADSGPLAFYTGYPFTILNSNFLNLGIGKCPGSGGSNCSPDFAYVGGFMRSTLAFQYGYFEVGNVNCTLKDGAHPDFWLFDEGSHASNFEVDIAEFSTLDRTLVHQNVHWDNDPNGFGFLHDKETSKSTGSSTSWCAFQHNYGVLWTPDLIRFYVDDAPSHTGSGQDLTATDIKIPDVPLAVRMSMQVGPTFYTGAVDASVDDTIQWIDYVRVWQHCTGCACAGSHIQ